MQTRHDIHSGLETLLRHAVAIGAVVVALLPAARGFSPTFGWMPLWLVAMPLCAWWALHRFRLPSRESDAAAPVRVRRRVGAQARRRRPSMLRRRHTQAGLTDLRAAGGRPFRHGVATARIASGLAALC